MQWTVLFHPAFEQEFDQLVEATQDAILARAGLLEINGPQLGRPHADTLKQSRHANMKKLRVDADNGVWRIAFAFDPKRQAVLLVAGDKTGMSKRRFYKRLIATADARFDDHLNTSEG